MPKYDIEKIRRVARERAGKPAPETVQPQADSSITMLSVIGDIGTPTAVAFAFYGRVGKVMADEWRITHGGEAPQKKREGAYNVFCYPTDYRLRIISAAFDEAVKSSKTILFGLSCRYDLVEELVLDRWPSVEPVLLTTFGGMLRQYSVPIDSLITVVRAAVEVPGFSWLFNVVDVNDGWPFSEEEIRYFQQKIISEERRHRIGPVIFPSRRYEEVGI